MKIKSAAFAAILMVNSAMAADDLDVKLVTCQAEVTLIHSFLYLEEKAGTSAAIPVFTEMNEMDAICDKDCRKNIIVLAEALTVGKDTFLDKIAAADEHFATCMKR